MRGAFTAEDAHAAAMTLVAYTIGLVPFVLIRSVVAPFLARGDTATPVKAALIGTAVNIVFKIALMGPLAQVGLALATSIGAWINFILVLWFAVRAGLHRIRRGAQILAGQARGGWYRAGAGARHRGARSSPSLLSSWSRFRNESELLLLALLGGVVYGGLVVALFGRRWLSLMRRRAQARRRRRSMRSKAPPRRSPGRTRSELERSLRCA